MAQSQDLNVDPRFAKMKTLFYVIGGQKCGTTWLHSFFYAHPEAIVPVWKELNYWNTIEGMPGQTGINKAYESLFGENGTKKKRFYGLWQPKLTAKEKSIALSHRALASAGPPHSDYASVLMQRKKPRTVAWGECCPQYALLSKDSFANMAAIAPQTRFIFTFRDPLARIISGVKHHLRTEFGAQNVTKDILYERLQLETGRKMYWPMRMSDYPTTINRLEAAVPIDHIKYMFFEDMFAQAKIDDMCDFLGICSKDGQFGVKENSDPNPHMDIPEELQTNIVRALSDVYLKMDEKFGDALPEAWRVSMKKLDGQGAQS